MQESMAWLAEKLDGEVGSLRAQKARKWDTPLHFIYGIELWAGVIKALFWKAMDAEGVPVRSYFNALQHFPHVLEWYRPCPVADEIASRTVALPFHSGLTM